MRCTRTRLISRVATLGLLGALLLSPVAALAQTTTAPPYPGEPTTIPPASTATDFNVGPVPAGGVVNVSECNWKPGTTVTLVVNPPGTTISPSVVADSSGCIVVHIEVLSQLVSMGATRLHPFAATGLAATATKVQVRVNGQTVTVGPYGTAVNVISNGTGVNGQPRTVTISLVVEPRGTVTRSGLVRTGTTIIKWTPFGLGLVGIGYLLVLASKRRRSAAA